VTERPSTATVVRITLTVAAVAVGLYGLYLIRSILVLVLVAVFFAVALDPIVRVLGRIRLKRSRAVAVVFLGVIIFIAGFFASVTPPLVRQTEKLATSVPKYVNDLGKHSKQFKQLDEKYNISSRLKSAVNNVPAIAGASLGGALGIVRSVGSAVFSVLTVMILTIYFLIDLPGLLAGAAKLIPKTRRGRWHHNSQVVFDRISGYMLGNIGVSVVAGVASFIALTLLRVPYALPLAMWVAIADLIPMVGATLGAVPAVIVAFFGGLWTGIGTVVFFLVYQQVENYLVAPRVMKRAVDISPAAVILAALIGATLLGFVGALLAIPFAASIKVLTQEIWVPRQEAA
jgi:predicted PurR-regulated permease PerM